MYTNCYTCSCNKVFLQVNTELYPTTIRSWSRVKWAMFLSTSSIIFPDFPCFSIFLSKVLEKNQRKTCLYLPFAHPEIFRFRFSFLLLNSEARLEIMRSVFLSWDLIVNHCFFGDSSFFFFLEKIATPRLTCTLIMQVFPAGHKHWSRSMPLKQ